MKSTIVEPGEILERKINRAFDECPVGRFPYDRQLAVAAAGTIRLTHEVKKWIREQRRNDLDGRIDFLVGVGLTPGGGKNPSLRLGNSADDSFTRVERHRRERGVDERSKSRAKRALG